MPCSSSHFPTRFPEALAPSLLEDDELSVAESVDKGFRFRYAGGEMAPRLELEEVRVCDGWNDEAVGIRASSATVMHTRELLDVLVPDSVVLSGRRFFCILPANIFLPLIRSGKLQGVECAVQ